MRRVLVGILLALAAAPAAALDWDLQTSDAGDIPLPNGGGEQTACLVGDLDGDGRNDIVIGERTIAPSVVVLFLRETGWEVATIEPAALDIEAGGLLEDIDSDGDLDLLLAGGNAINEIWWWENPGPPPYATAWTRRLIKNSGSTHQHDQVIGDFDGDGARELVFWNKNSSNRLYLADFPADPKATQPWPFTEIFQAPTRPEGLAKGDIDLDGRVDIVGAGYWFEHVSGTTYTPHLIESGRTFTRTVVGQFVPGGRPEVVHSPGDEIGPLTVNEWVDGAWATTVLDPVVKHGHTLERGDVDQDGLLDFYVAEMHTPGAGDQARSRIFLNQGGGVFQPEYVDVGRGNHESRLADIDGDGWLDIVGKPFDAQAPGLNLWFQVPPVPAGPDTLAPVVRWVRATDPGGTVLLQFDEAVDDSSAGLAANYVITGGVAVQGVDLQPDGRTVHLTVTGLDPGFPHGLTVDGILDRADPPNAAGGQAPVWFEHRPWARHTDGLLALYEFRAGQGTVVFDTAPDGFPLDLSVPDTTKIAWSDGAVTLTAATALVSDEPAVGVSGACATSGAVTIEAWLATADLGQNGPARIVTISQDSGARNVTLGQGDPGGGDRYSARLRTTTTDANGLPTAASGGGTVTGGLQHMVLTRDTDGDLRLYVDGALEHQEIRGGDLSGWDPAYHLAVGGEPDPVAPRPWLGTLHLVALYDRALSAGEVADHFALGAEAPDPVVASTPSALGSAVTVAPNPFNARVRLAIESTTEQEAEIAVYDLRGRRIVTLAAKTVLRPGPNAFLWDGRDDSGAASPSGIYFFRVRTADRTTTVKSVLAK